MLLIENPLTWFNIEVICVKDEPGFLLVRQIVYFTVDVGDTFSEVPTVDSMLFYNLSRKRI